MGKNKPSSHKIDHKIDQIAVKWAKGHTMYRHLSLQDPQKFIQMVFLVSRNIKEIEHKSNTQNCQDPPPPPIIFFSIKWTFL
jgi:hypothetical protein